MTQKNEGPKRKEKKRKEKKRKEKKSARSSKKAAAYTRRDHQRCQNFAHRHKNNIRLSPSSLRIPDEKTPSQNTTLHPTPSFETFAGSAAPPRFLDVEGFQRAWVVGIAFIVGPQGVSPWGLWDFERTAGLRQCRTTARIERMAGTWLSFILGAGSAPFNDDLPFGYHRTLFWERR